MFKRLVMILIVGHMVNEISSANNDIYFSKIGMEQGLSQLSVMSIYQDELGMMWFGTREGISIFDGNGIEKIIPLKNDSNSLVSAVIKNICGNRDGLVYIHSDDGVNVYDLRANKMHVVQRTNTDAISYGISNLWIADQNKLSSYINGEKKLYVELKNIDSPIKKILQTRDQRLVIGTLSSGVFIIDQNKKYRCVIPSSSQVSTLFEDDKKNIWVGTWQNGLYKIDRSGKVVNYQHKGGENSISSNFVRAICQDNKQNLWIGTRNGLDKLDAATQMFKSYEAGGAPALTLSNESVWSIYKDMQGNIWIGTYFGGVNYFNPEIDYYNLHNLRSGFFLNRPFPIISQIIEDKNKQLLLCTEGDGLILYNPVTQTYINLREGSGSNALSSNNIKTGFYDDQKHELWLGTHLEGITKVDLNTLRTKQMRQINVRFPQSEIVRVILPYKDELMVATYNGLFILNPKTYEIRLFSEKLHKAAPYIVDLVINENELWVAGVGLFRYNFKTEKVTAYFHDKNDEFSLSNNHLMKLFVDSKNRMWIASNGGGVNLYVPEKDHFIHYDTHSTGFNNDYVSNIIETKYGYLYVSTTQGLTVLDPETGKSYNYSSANGFPLNSLFNGGMKAIASGEVYVAGMNGMVSFAEENLLNTQKSFNLNFTNIWVNNKLVVPQDESNVLTMSLPYSTDIQLNHKQSMITIAFATNNYTSFNKPSYRYKLDGQSDVWIELPGGVNKLNFMNLTPGKYKLYLQALSQIDNQVIASTALNIKISPPIYKTSLAYIIYILLIAIIIWRYLIFVRSKLLLATSLDYEKKQIAHLEEVNQSKLRFFTNISHEFRTPLTLIKGQVDLLLQMQQIQPTVYNRILNIKRNTLTMHNLINELLQFRKAEQGHLQIKVYEQDFAKFMYEIYLSFIEYGSYRNIQFNFECTDDRLPLWFDAVQIQKVFYNLISNAFKYTPKEGTIDIRVTQTADTVEVKIADSGIGISTDVIEKIFDRFYQAENGLQISDMAPGTGIGLALAKSILETHHAHIAVESKAHVGTVFTVQLKKGSAHFSDEQKTVSTKDTYDYRDQINDIDDDFMLEVKSTQRANNEPLYTMLIVEDNKDLREMLKDIFEPIYKVYTAADGGQGLEMTLLHQPDIVLSDLMMPIMSGSEMCSKIKNNFQISHIPVVLLTAQTAVEYNIEGLRLGADDYITKPFNVKTLITRCNNLVNNRRMLQDKFSRQTEFTPRLVATNKMDCDFLEKAQMVVEQHLDDSEFDIPAFSREMALGRTKLFTKLKGITGQTPNEFIQNVRLKKAAAMLSNNPEFNISDITYMLGFSSPKYFSKCFKEQFGISPSTYRKGDENADVEDEDEDKD